MFDNIIKFFKKLVKENKKDSKDTAKERLHLVLMQDRANVSADFMELMKQEIIEVIKKYIDVDENSIDVKLTNKVNSDGTTGAPILYANIPILNVKDDTKQIHIERKLEKQAKQEEKKESKEEDSKEKVTVENKEEKKPQEEKTGEKKETLKKEETQEQTDTKQEKQDEGTNIEVKEQTSEEEKEELVEESKDESKNSD